MTKTNMLVITALGLGSWCVVIAAGNVIAGAFH